MYKSTESISCCTSNGCREIGSSDYWARDFIGTGESVLETLLSTCSPAAFARFEDASRLPLEARPYVLKLVCPLLPQMGGEFSGPSGEAGVAFGLPSPASGNVVDDDNLPSLAAAYQLHSLQSYHPLATEQTIDAFLNNGTLLSWSTVLHQHLSGHSAPPFLRAPFRLQRNVGLRYRLVLCFVSALGV
ncbi:uncharacterized protein EI90DRAFT_2366769 [Cantharellus anzutake]|uniref:uncharacterized protein n=1 Tax=Cantharellus anzutake TaxID=1750568 RepID=UPI001907B110|nr:uncharacterized protein EI90DRAFT_2366769 [Cantharellus anzutake]KAF8324195.1 hypothetical protein EI90DRAFT_2366769 [Cantharellus anzutake]